MPTSHTGAWARPTRISNQPGVISVFVRYPSASSCWRSPAGPSTRGMPLAFAYPRMRRLKWSARRISLCMGCFIRSGQGHPSGSRRDPAPSGNRHSTGSGRRSHSCRPQQILMAFAPRVGPVSQLSTSRAIHANSGRGTVRLPDFAARRATFSRRSPRTNVDRSVKGNGDFVPVVGLRAANPTASMSSFRRPSGAPVDPALMLKPRAATRPLQGCLRIPPVALRYPFKRSFPAPSPVAPTIYIPAVHERRYRLSLGYREECSNQTN